VNSPLAPEDFDELDPFGASQPPSGPFDNPLTDRKKTPFSPSLDQEDDPLVDSHLAPEDFDELYPFGAPQPVTPRAVR
jgi:hypothetical protein